MRNYFTFGEYDSRDFGVFITRDGVYNAPKRAYRQVQVPGRNGDLMIDEGRLENINVTYPALIYSRFDSNIEGLRNALLSQKGYVRITDSYHPDEYRLGCFSEELSVLPQVLGDGGTFDVTFNCKPQRFLVSGETPITIGEWGETETASGEIVSIELEEGQAFKSVVADINPVQDLHGYDHPWPAGGGKNIANPQNSSNTDRTFFTYSTENELSVVGTKTASGGKFFAKYTVPVVAESEYVFSFGTFQINGTNSPVNVYIYEDDLWGTNITSFSINATTKTRTWTSTKTGTVAVGIYISGGDTGKSLSLSGFMIRLATETDPTFAPYSNICPITGHTSATVTRTGKNLIPYPYYRGSRTVNGITFTVNTDGTIGVRGTATAVAVFYLRASTSGNFGLVDGEQYTLTGCPATGSSTTYKLDLLDTTSAQAAIASDFGSGRTFTYDATRTPGAVRIVVYSGVTLDVVFKPMLRLASDTDDTYEPYQGNTYPITFPSSAGTVYGGYVDAVNGKLVVDRVEVDLGTKTWTRRNTSNGHFRFTAEANIYIPTSTSEIPDIICSVYPTITPAESWLGTFGISCNTSAAQILVSDEQYATAGDFRTAMEGVQAVYKLATPIEYDLTPTQIAALVGTNNIWADTGDVSVEYGNDPNVIKNPTLFNSKPLIEVTFDTSMNNMVPFPYYVASPYTHNGITFTANGREITANGTATARAWFTMVWHGSIPEGTYHISGVPDAPGVEIDCWFQRKSDNVQLANFVATSGGLDFTVTQELAEAYWNLQIYVASGTTLVNEIVNPMVKASGSGSVLYVGDSRITLTNNYPSISIDSEIQDCYYDTNNANPYVEFTDDDFPELPPGATGITFGSGISDVKITPRWFIV